MKIGFVSLGCSKNQVDSEKILGVLGDNHELVSDYNQADFIFINTCAFIESAKKEAIDKILEMADYKENGKCQKLIVLGCMAERYRDELAEELPEVDLFIKISEYSRIQEIFHKDLGLTVASPNFTQRKLLSGPYSAYLKIAEGCSNCCTYCAIPLIRGSFRSIPKEELILEAKALANKGVKELVLIAQDTTMYGYDLYGYYALGELLKELSEIDGIVWLRVLYMYPHYLTTELIETMNSLPKVLMYFDVPLQHGSDRMLRKMNRKGTIGEFKELVEVLKRTKSPYVLRTTMMVGFPFEEDEDFKEMLNLLKEVKFNKLGAFIYSKEEDTPAYTFNHQIKQEVAKRRYRELLLLQKDISLALNKELVGQTLEVLIENKIEGGYLGRSLYQSPDGVDGNFYVLSDKEINIGDFVMVKVIKANTYDLYGEVI